MGFNKDRQPWHELYRFFTFRDLIYRLDLFSHYKGVNKCLLFITFVTPLRV